MKRSEDATQSREEEKALIERLEGKALTAKAR